MLGLFFKIITCMKTFKDYTREELLSRKIGPETSKSFEEKLNSGFWSKYAGGKNIIEMGYDGGLGCVPFLPNATGIDKNYPGYDGINLPFLADLSQDTVYASHVYEHIADWKSALQEWYRVLKVGGYLIIAIPHVWLYEKKPDLPSKYNLDHKRFYAPHDLLEEIWQALPHLGYRIKHLCDNDTGWDDGWKPNVQMFEKRNHLGEFAIEAGYVQTGPSGSMVVSAGEMNHSDGCYEIECVIEKTTIPVWTSLLFKNRKILGRG